MRNKSLTKDVSSRNIAMDILRIIACFLVILYHSRGVYQGDNLFNKLCGFGAFFFGKLGVPFFLLIGGYFAFNQKLDAFSFLKKRLSRIVFPTLFWLIVPTLLIGGTENFFNNVLDLKCAGHLWYMYALIGILFLVPIINPYLQKTTGKELSLYISIWCITLILNGNYFDAFKNYEITDDGMSGSNPIFAFLNFYGYFGYYLLGFVASKYTLKSKHVILMTIGGLCSLLIFMLIFRMNVYSSWFYLSIPVTLVSFAVFNLFKNINPYLLTNLAKWGGDNIRIWENDFRNILGACFGFTLHIQGGVLSTRQCNRYGCNGICYFNSNNFYYSTAPF